MSASVGERAAAPSTPERRALLGRRAQLLAGTSVAYNVVEAVVAVSAGVVAGSVALVGFGLDSVVEVSSGLIILWQFRHAVPEQRERRAQRLIALSFFALAAYVAVESARALLTGAEPGTSRVGIALAAISLAVMPVLSWAQRRTGRQLGSRSVQADGTQTLLCTYLSAVLLAGLLLNAALGWWWADPVAGLVIAVVAAREGRETWRGDGCCAPPSPVDARGADGAVNAEDGACGCGADCADACCTDAARRDDGRPGAPDRRNLLQRRSTGADDGRTRPVSGHRSRGGPPTWRPWLRQDHGSP